MTPKAQLLSRPLIAHVLSDHHGGSHSGDVARLLAIANASAERRPDLVLLPGDFMNMMTFGGGRIPPDAVISTLAPLLAVAPAVAVLGNHDHEYGAEAVSNALRAAGIVVLENASTEIVTSAGVVTVAGLADESEGRPDFSLAIRDVEPDTFSIVLAHDPASFRRVSGESWIMVSGHTHGGQICLPGFGPIVNASDAPLAWSRGHIADGGNHLIVSAGLGTSGLPFRFRCPPEIVELRIVGC